VSTRAEQKIALFFNGRKHAGENLAAVLARRAQELGPPIQMCDALSRNLPKEFQAVGAIRTTQGQRFFHHLLKSRVAVLLAESQHLDHRSRTVLPTVPVVENLPKLS
jgi:hypothetical protein